MNQPKPRVIKDFDKLDKAIQEQVKLAYPMGFSEYLITYTDKEGRYRTALPFETDEKMYLLRMTEVEAEQLIEDDEDYDNAGTLKNTVKEEYEGKYSELEYMSDYIDKEDDEDD